MKTPDPNDPKIEGLEPLNSEEAGKNAIMKPIESLKQHMNNSLKNWMRSITKRLKK